MHFAGLLVISCALTLHYSGDVTLVCSSEGQTGSVTLDKGIRLCLLVNILLVSAYVVSISKLGITQVDHLSSPLFSPLALLKKRSGAIRLYISFRIAVPDRSGLLS